MENVYYIGNLIYLDSLHCVKSMKKLFLFFFLGLLGCDSNFNNYFNDHSNPKDYLFVASKIKQFPTENFFSGKIYSLQFFKDSEKYLSFLVPNENKLIVYNYDDETLFHIQEFQIEGPYGVGELGFLSSHYNISKDSLLIYNFQNGVLFLLNDSSSLLNSFRVSNYKDPEVMPAPFPNSIRPIQYINQTVYLSSGLTNRLADFSGFPSVVKIDLLSKKVNFFGEFSNLYSKAYWGNTFKYDPAIAILDERIYINFPIDFGIHFSDLKGLKFEIKKIGSDYFKEIPYFKENSNYFLSINPNERNLEEDYFSLSNSDFAGLLVDEQREMLYRIAYLRPSLEEVQRGDRIPDFSVIVLDKNLNKLTEKRFDGKIFDCEMIFVSDEGLNIFRKDLYLKDENFMSFEVWSVERPFKN